MKMGALGKLNILIAEDDENDRLLYKRALARTNVNHRIETVCDGQEAIDYLCGAGEYQNRDRFPFPNALIMDLKMPRCSGFDLLQWLHEHEECKVIPTIVLSSSAQASDIKKAFMLSANSYFTKPSSFEDTVALFNLIFNYWFKSLVPDPPPAGKCI